MHVHAASRISPLRDRTYRRLFAAQAVALVGTGVTTVALSLLAYDLAGDDAGVVLGVALALKMIAYVVVAPMVAGLLAGVDRRRLLVTLDLLRAGTVLALPFVTQVWQVLVLVVVVNACSAGFTPAFQATIPDVLPDEARYTRALSLSRVAYELETLLSPLVAAAALLVVSFHALFAVNGVAFLASAALVLSVSLPPRRAGSGSGATSGRARVTAGVRAYLAVPRLRALLALNVAVASGGAMVLVNTVVLVRDASGRGSDVDVALALGAAGAGAMLAALLLPRVLERAGDRRTMLGGAVLLPVGLLLTATLPGYVPLLGVWLLLGVGLAVVETPAGRLVHRSAGADDEPALFAAQFSLSHACWLVTYPVAGVLGARIGLAAVAVLLAALATVAVSAAARLWVAPTVDPPRPGTVSPSGPGGARAR